MENQQLTPEQVVGYLERANLPPGTKLLIVAFPPDGVDVPEPADFGARKKHKNYTRFVKTSDAVTLMDTQVREQHLRDLANQAIAGEFVGFKEGTHFKDLSSHGSKKARWVFHPERCDAFFSRSADSRVKPGRRRKAS